MKYAIAIALGLAGMYSIAWGLDLLDQHRPPSLPLARTARAALYTGFILLCAAALVAAP